MSLTIPETQVPRDKLRAAVQTIVDEADPEAIYLFGSQARGDAGPRSDVDLLILVDTPPNRLSDITSDLYHTLRGSGFGKELILMTPEQFEESKNIPGTVAREIARDGKLLYERA